MTPASPDFLRDRTTSTRALYLAALRFFQLVVRVYFRTIEVVGTQHVPVIGPVIFVGNHPNSLLDPVMIATQCGRVLSFAAKATLFENIIGRWLLPLLGAVPIHRRQDQKDPGDALDNNAAFAALFQILRREGAFGIFPEGISHARSELAPLKTGAARIALGAAVDGIAVQIVPCGLNYYRRDRIRSRVLVQFGEAIVVDDVWKTRFLENPAETSRLLTDQIELALRALTINASDFDTLRVLDGVRRIYVPPAQTLGLAERAELARRFLTHYAVLRDKPEVKSFFSDVEAYLFSLHALGLHDRDLQKPISRMFWMRRLIGHAALIFLWLPFALPGIVLHAPILVLAVMAGASLTQRKDVVATWKLCVATALTFALYVVIVVVFILFAPTLALGLTYAPLVLGALLLSGWATIRVLERQSVLRKVGNVTVAMLTLKRTVANLRDERKRLRERLLTLVDTYAPVDLERIVTHHGDRSP